MRNSTIEICRCWSARVTRRAGHMTSHNHFAKVASVTLRFFASFSLSTYPAFLVLEYDRNVAPASANGFNHWLQPRAITTPHYESFIRQHRAFGNLLLGVCAHQTIQKSSMRFTKFTTTANNTQCWCCDKAVRPQVAPP